MTNSGVDARRGEWYNGGGENMKDVKTVKTGRSVKKGIVKILILVLFLEVFVFNYQSYRVLSSNNKKEFNQEDFSKYETNDNYTYVEIDNLSDEI